MKRKIFVIVTFCLTIQAFSGYFPHFSPYGKQIGTKFLETSKPTFYKASTPFIRQTPPVLVNTGARTFNTQAQNFGYWTAFRNRFSNWRNQFRNYIPQSMRNLFTHYRTPLITTAGIGAATFNAQRLIPDKPNILIPHVLMTEEHQEQDIEQPYIYTDDDRQKIFNILSRTHIAYDSQASTAELFELFAKNQAQKIANDDIKGTNRTKFRMHCNNTALDAKQYPIFRKVIGEILIVAKNEGKPLSFIRRILNAYVDVMPYQIMYKYANLAEDIIGMLETNDQKKEDKLLLTMDLLNKDPGAAFMFNFGILHNTDRRPAKRLNSLMLNKQDDTINKLLNILVQHSGDSDTKINSLLEGPEYDKLRNELIHRRQEYDRKNEPKTTSRFMPAEPADII